MNETLDTFNAHFVQLVVCSTTLALDGK
jgi:hypothetical protein